MDKYQDLRIHKTNGANCDLETEDIIAKLRLWDNRYGIELFDVASDKVKVVFKNLPDDVSSLAREIYEFCPDIIEQHFGCFQEIMEAAEDGQIDLPESFYELIDGVNLQDEDYGLELLKKSLKNEKVISLWWD